MNEVKFDVKLIPAGTGSAVWDEPYANRLIQRFMPPQKQHGPMIGILDLASVRPTPGVLTDVIVRIGEDVRAGRYGSFSFIVSSKDDATRSVVSQMAFAQDLPIFVSSSPTRFVDAVAAGSLTESERNTLSLVLQAGGTLTAAGFAEKNDVEQTTAGNRLIALHKKGYLQRLARPHPYGDLFIDPRSIHFDR